MMPRHVSGTYRLPYTLKAEGAGYLVGLIILGLASLMGIYAAAEHAHDWWCASLFSIPVVFWFYSLDNSEITITRDRIVSKSLSGPKMVHVSNIARMEIDDSLVKNRVNTNVNGRYQLLGMFDARNNKLAVINLKPFSKRECAILFDTIVTEVPTVEVNDRVKGIMEGRYKPDPTNGAGLKQFAKLGLYLLLALAIYETARDLMLLRMMH